MKPSFTGRVTGPAEVQLACADLAPTLAFFVGELGFRVETIFPAEEPTTASLSGHGLRLRLAPEAGDAGHIRLPCDTPPEGAGRVRIAPNGAIIEWVAADPPIDVPPMVAEFVLTRRNDGPGQGPGRAGMIYRDLIPGRLGGRFIASHISIPVGGPVPDWAHFHKVRFQMIFCRSGWARLVYEDQGPSFILAAGDCVLQPPRIRHRVLEASDGFEVVEIGCPALHETLADHEMALPTATTRPDRDFDGQVFMRHVAADAPWSREGDTGFERQSTAMSAATRGLVDVTVLRSAGGADFETPSRRAELRFAFVLRGTSTLEYRGSHDLGPADAFVIPPGEPWALARCSADFSLLEVTAA
jgi:quercetin dioxygenase-like cupin family protein